MKSLGIEAMVKNLWKLMMVIIKIDIQTEMVTYKVQWLCFWTNSLRFWPNECKFHHDSWGVKNKSKIIGEPSFITVNVKPCRCHKSPFTLLIPILKAACYHYLVWVAYDTL